MKDEKKNQALADLQDIRRLVRDSRQYNEDKVVLMGIIDALSFLVERPYLKESPNGKEET